MLTPSASLVLGFAFVLMGGVNVWLVLEAWARVKAELRRAAARNEDALQRALGPALDRVSAENARAYFRHCGHDRPD